MCTTRLPRFFTSHNSSWTPKKILFVFIVFPLRPHVDRGVRRRRFIEVRANLCGVASSFKLRRPRRTPLDLEKKKRTTLSLIDGVVGLGVDQARGVGCPVRAWSQARRSRERVAICINLDGGGLCGFNGVHALFCFRLKGQHRIYYPTGIVSGHHAPWRRNGRGLGA